jgi:hypothetical protein
MMVGRLSLVFRVRRISFLPTAACRSFGTAI